MMTAPITATSQQTRFRPGSTLSKEIDLSDVSVSIGSNELLTSTHLKLSEGVKYVLVGRNGTGKSTLLRAISEKIIPGIPKEMKILALDQQVEKVKVEKEGETVLEWLVRSDKEMENLKVRIKVLSEALESGNLREPARVLRRWELEAAGKDLEEARRIALLRSGARGLKARKEQKRAEIVFAECEKRLQVGADEDVSSETNQAVSLLADLEHKLSDLSPETAPIRAHSLLSGLGFSPTTISSPVLSLSSGSFTRLSLATILFTRSDLLLLDEPTNFLDLPTILWLERHLSSHPSTLVLITHDRTFADTIADEVLILKNRTLEHFNGNLSAYHAVRAEKVKNLTKMAAAQEKQKAHMEASIASAKEAAKRSGDQKKLAQAASRQKKLDERMGMQVNAKGGRFKLNRDLAGYHFSNRPEIEIPQDEAPQRITLPQAPDIHPAGSLASIEKLTFAYKIGQPAVLKDVNITIHPATRFGILGLNGAGKSTLVNLLLGQLLANSPSITRHPRARFAAYSPASVEALANEDRPALHVLNLPTESEGRTALAALGLSGRVVSEVPVRLLSGGQKVRLALAKLINPIPPHCLVLDEVTTHLDADTVVALAEALRGWRGGLVVVSHDRWFVRRVIEGEDEGDEEEEEGVEEGRVVAVVKGRVKVLEGGVGEFEELVRKGKVKV